MKDFCLGLIAHASPLGKKQQNLAATEYWVRQAKRKGADLVVLPELSITGHGGHPAMIAEAERVPDGDAVNHITGLAAELGIYICAGIAESEAGAVYNTQFIVGPEGFIGKQRKVHLSHDEYFLFRGGTSVPVFDLPFACVGLVICYDNLLPEMARICAVRGAELILSPHAARFGAWPRGLEGRRKAVANLKQQWRVIHRCRALENGVYVGLCNTVGRSAGGRHGVQANHAGGCMIVDPGGQVAAESRSRDIVEQMLIRRLQADKLHQVRRQICFNLRTRRSDAFEALAIATE